MTLPSVTLLIGRIVVRHASAIDENLCDETISLNDVVEMVLERGMDEDGLVLHWFLQHRRGWTLHFNNRFDGAAMVSSELQRIFGFSLPPIDAIAGPGMAGTVVWP